MQRRVFVGIELPAQIKKRLGERVQKWLKLPIKWGREDNYHITLSFLGYVEDTELPEICRSLNHAAKNISAFDIFFDKITFGPDAENPKVVWLSGKASEELKNLVENIEKELGIFLREKKEFRPHVTLGRIQKIKWKELGEVSVIDERLSVAVSAENIVLFESRMEKGKRMFDILEICPLD